MVIAKAKKDTQRNTPDWQMVRDTIDGVAVREVLHVPGDLGIITEIYRPEWDPSGLSVTQVYQLRLFPGALDAWSCHMKTVDRLFVSQGLLKVVLYDGREQSPTYGRVMQLHVGEARPTFIVLPPGIWHGLQNVGTGDAMVINLPSVAYDYADPDHYRLPYDSPEIPHAWGIGPGTRLHKHAAG